MIHGTHIACMSYMRRAVYERLMTTESGLEHLVSKIEQAVRRFQVVGRARARFLASASLALLLFTGLAVIVPGAVRAHAPGTAVVEFDQPLLEAPFADSAALAELAAGSEVELTGDADGQYVEVVANGVIGWVDLDLIHAGQIDTAITSVMTPITDAPSEDGQLLAVVPAGDTVILTGAAVDEFLAGSYNGTGGWLPAASLE